MGRYYEHLLAEERRLTPEHVARNMGFYEMEQFVKRRTLLECRQRLAVESPRILKFDAWEEASRQGVHNVLPRYVEELLAPCTVAYLDLDELLLREAMTKHGSRDKAYLAGRIEALPFGHEVFDVLIDFSTTDHLFDDGDFARTISESKRVLKSGGLYLLYHANADYLFAHRRSTYHKPRSIDFVRQVLEAEGFAITSHGFFYPLVYDPTTAWRALSEAGRAILRHMPERIKHASFTFFNLRRFNELFFLLARRNK